MADKKTFKVTKNMTRDYLLSVLLKNLQAINSDVDPKATKDLPARVDDAIANKDDKKAVTRNTLGNLCKEVCDALGDKFIEVPIPPKAENAVKKSEDKKTKKEKTPEKPPLVTPAPPLLASAFPSTLQVKDEAGNVRTVTIDHGCKTFKDLREGLNNGKVYVFAYYWSKRHLKQFQYRWCEAPKNPEAFPDDLDTAQIVFVGENHPVAYVVSDYTEAIYTVYENDLEEVDGIRFCNGVEFQLYAYDPATANTNPGNPTA